jgi:hypothetical protein
VAATGAVLAVRSASHDDPPPGRSALVQASTAGPVRLGAHYVAAEHPGAGQAIELCSLAAASWTQSGGTVVVAVRVSGPVLVAASAIDRVHPERPSTSHDAVTVPMGRASLVLKLPAPSGGVDRVQLGIRGDEGIQQCAVQRRT